jgi:hypothetical protein
MPKTGKQLYTAKSQFWLGESLYRPIDMGGRAIEEGDPILKKLPDRFALYEPRVREYPGRVEQATAAPGERR